MNRSPLAYPAGAVPGIDLSHPASRGLMVSLFPAGGNVINFGGAIGPRQGTIAAGPITYGINSTMGPITTATASSTAPITFQKTSLGATVPAGTEWTMAFVGTANRNDGNTVALNPGNVTGSLFIGNDGTNFILREAGVQTFSSGISCAPTGIFGIPFFYAASAIYDGTNLIHTHVVVNLLTGQVQTSGPTTTAASAPADSTSLSFGGFSSDQTLGPAMWSSKALKLAELRQWAADPWAFWYPRRTIQYTTPATTTTTGGARFKQRWNRSPLAYPAGAVPGVDWSHPASKNLVISNVPAGTNQRILNLGGQMTVSGAGSTASAGIDGGIGPFAFRGLGGGTSALTYAGSSATQSRGTMAAIFRPIGNTAQFFGKIIGTGSIGSSTEVMLGIRNNAGISFIYNSGTISLATPSQLLGVPFFACASWIDAVYYSHVVINLATGQIVAANTGSSLGSSSYNDSLIVSLNDSFGQDTNASVGPVMYSHAVLTLQELLQWGRDPWGFWYPNKTINLSSSAASVGGGGFLAAWARWISNLPVIGTGNY